MPPASSLEDYLDLITAIEATSAELQLPVVIEGYKPPSDPRVSHFAITPDPGVIEVNTQPSQTWRELENITTTLYEEARLTRLATETSNPTGRCVTGSMELCGG